MNANLEEILGGLITAQLQTKDFHWNLRGREFLYLHPMLDELYSDLNEYSDTLAERARAIGQHVTGSVEYSYTSEPIRFDDAVDELSSHLNTISVHIKNALGSYDGDPATQDVLIEIQRGLDKWVWMFNESLS
jgi:starvation-inducible DNA-binding protein